MVPVRTNECPPTPRHWVKKRRLCVKGQPSGTPAPDVAGVPQLRSAAGTGERGGVPPAACCQPHPGGRVPGHRPPQPVCVLRHNPHLEGVLAPCGAENGARIRTLQQIRNQNCQKGVRLLVRACRCLICFEEDGGAIQRFHSKGFPRCCSVSIDVVQDEPDEDGHTGDLGERQLSFKTVQFLPKSKNLTPFLFLYNFTIFLQ